MTELMRESEASNARLAEESKILKEGKDLEGRTKVLKESKNLEKRQRRQGKTVLAQTLTGMSLFLLFLEFKICHV